MRKFLSIYIAKFLIILGKLLGKKGSSTPGAIALKICPNVLCDLAKNVDKTIVVCGTNGKTTTNNMIYEVLSKNENVVCNNVGANMIYGVATAFIVNYPKKAKYACLEVDEFSARHVFKALTPDYIVLTNLFRDQLDRYGEIDIAINALKEALELASDAKLILNADDPLVASFANYAQKSAIFYGIDEDVIKSDFDSPTDGLFCRNCGEELTYNYKHYNQLGDYFCSSCGLLRPTPEFGAKNVELSPNISFDIDGIHLEVPYRGLYNIYNILASVAVCKSIGAEVNNEIFGKYKPQIGRMEKFTINSKDVVFNLSKNPAGFNQSIQTALEDGRKKSIIFILNDNAQDGTDISWIWDVDFERFQDDLMFISGTRKDDLHVRLKYGEKSSECIKKCENDGEAIKSAIESECEVIYVLVNYTALFSTHKILKNLEETWKL